MGHVYADFELSNPRRPELSPVVIHALVDTGAMMLCIPPAVASQLDLETNSHRDVTVADGRLVRAPYVGAIQVRFENPMCFVGALVLGDEPLMGAVPMEDLDLVISPGRQTVTVHPDHPNFPHHLVKVA